MTLVVLIVACADDAVWVQSALERASFSVRQLRATGHLDARAPETCDVGILVHDLVNQERNAWLDEMGFGASGKVVVLPRADPAVVARLLDLGFDDVVHAAVAVDELVARVRAVHRRLQASPRWSSCGMIRVSRTERIMYVSDVRVALTQCEWALLSVLLERAGDAVSRAELLGLVWSDCKAEGSNFLNVHIARLRQKLGVAAEYLQCVRGVGYRLQPPGSGMFRVTAPSAINEGRVSSTR